MKKLIIIPILLLVVSCLKSSSSPNGTYKVVGESKNVNGSRYQAVDVISYNISGMHYKVFYTGSQGGSYIVNVTKDSLEVSKLIRESKYGK